MTSSVFPTRRRPVITVKRALSREISRILLNSRISASRPKNFIFVTFLLHLAVSATAVSETAVSATAVSVVDYIKIPSLASRQQRESQHDPHGVFIWLTASIRFQRYTSLKTSPPCQPDGPEAGPRPQFRPFSGSGPLRTWRGDPSGHSASMAGEASESCRGRWPPTVSTRYVIASRLSS